MVTHNIEEAVYLSDKVIILSHRPGSVLKEVNMQIPRSREKKDKSIYEYSALYHNFDFIMEVYRNLLNINCLS